MKGVTLKTEEDYNEASLRLIEIFHTKEKTAEYHELEILIKLVEDYDDKNYRLKDIDN